MEKDLKPKFKWTRVRDGSNIKYVRTRIDNDRIIDEDFDFNTGKFKMYLNQDINSGFSYGTLTENKLKKENNEVTVIGSKKPKSWAYTRNGNSYYHPEDAEEFFNLTGLGLIINPFRLTNKVLNLLDKPSLSTATDLAPEVLPYSKAGRFALGTYNLFNKEGLPKTYNYIRQGEYGRAGLSALGDVLNAGMTIEGGTTVVPKIGKSVNTGMQIFNSPITGKWTTIGRNLYRFNPNMLGMNTISGVEKRAIVGKIPEGYTFIRELILNGQLKHIVKDPNGKFKVLEDLDLNNVKLPIVNLKNYTGEKLTGNEPGFDEWARTRIPENDHFPDLSHGINDIRDLLPLMNLEFESLPNGSRVDLGHIFSSDSSSNLLLFIRRNNKRIKVVLPESYDEMVVTNDHGTRGANSERIFNEQLEKILDLYGYSPDAVPKAVYDPNTNTLSVPKLSFIKLYKKGNRIKWS